VLKFCVLASGSAGNCALVATERTRILVDAGLSVRELTRRLAEIGESVDSLDAVLITHEHSDHVSGLCRLLRTRKRAKRPLPAYLTRLTAPVIDWEECEPVLETFQAGSTFRIGDIEVDSFTIPHDARDPVGFCFRAEGMKIAIATDLGYIPDSIKFHLRGTHMLLLMGRNGHLSNSVVCEYLAAEFASSVQALILGHLSDQNNHPELVRMGAAEALERRGMAFTRLVIAEQMRQTEVFQF
jgi:phosphoribosyl 1,2-cyclic phosphodiesterase